MAIFFEPDILKTLTLNEEESNHAVKVLRMQPGDKLEIVDGKGGYYEAEIVNAHRGHCMVTILNEIKEYARRPYKIHIAVAPTKNLDRIEWFVEKATEIGVSEITPIICTHSERKVIKQDRIEKIAISAMKQSKKAYLPKINEQQTFQQFVQEKRDGQLFIAHCYEQDKRELSQEYKAGNDITILIGPEGDFSPEEIDRCLSLGYKPVSLGTSRLRTETAALVAVHTAVLINDMNTLNK